jgi:hypothetical protein
LIVVDITIGTTISTRYHSSKWRDVLGNFINDVAMRVNFHMYNSGQQSRLELLHHVKDIHSAVMEHTSFPVCITSLLSHEDFFFFFFLSKLDTISRELYPQSTLTRNPLYRAMFLFQSQTSNSRINPDTLSLPSLTLQKEKCIDILDLGESLFDLTMELMPPISKGEAIEGDLIHSSALFSGSTIQNIVEVFIEILEEIASESEKQVETRECKRKRDEHAGIVLKRGREML